MTSVDKKWLINFSEDEWSDDYGESFKTSKEAKTFIDEVPLMELVPKYLEFTNDTLEELIDQGGVIVIYIGQAFVFDPQISAGDVIDSVSEQAIEQFSMDYLEGYLDRVTETQKADLEKYLKRAFNAWAKKHRQQPSFYSIKNVIEVHLDINEEYKKGELVGI